LLLAARFGFAMPRNGRRDQPASPIRLPGVKRRHTGSLAS
jgi:hypothetical protein